MYILVKQRWRWMKYLKNNFICTFFKDRKFCNFLVIMSKGLLFSNYRIQVKGKGKWVQLVSGFNTRFKWNADLARVRQYEILKLDIHLYFENIYSIN